MKKTAFTYASRKEIDVELICFEGEIPNDLSGFVFMNSPVGTVNYETPIPRYPDGPDGEFNLESGQQIFNGDGLVLRFDCDTVGKIRLKTGLMRTPCYYADYHSRKGTKYFEEGLYFKSKGLSRMSGSLGTRNQINTSINSFRYGQNKSPRLTANFDAGRPFEFDPVSLEVITPIGYSHQWRNEFPSNLVELPFEMFQSTAHPSFDADTQEYFTVCFEKSMVNLAFSKDMEQLLEGPDSLEEKFKDLYENVLEGMKIAEDGFFDLLEDFFGYVRKQKDDPTLPNYSKEKAKALLFKDKSTESGFLGMKNAVRLMRWKGKQEIEEWNLIDEEGNNIIINQTMHQTNLSKDYIILMDTSIKFSLEIIADRWFPHVDWFNNLVRDLLFKAIEPTTPMYIVRRADLVEGVPNVLARKVMIDIETAHFSVEYQNPDDVITLYASHNSAMCAAEWVRHFDTLAVNDGPVHDNTIGLMICGEMDISRIGKWKIDGNTARVLSDKKVYQKGFEGNDAKNLTEAHTWAVSLSTYRHIVSSRFNANKIPYMFWQFYGLDYRFLTTFIKDKYSEYQNRIISVDDILDYNRQGVPCSLSRQNTETMEFEDWYNFKMNQNFRSLQFVPKRDSQHIANEVEKALDGYILCTLVNGNEDFSGDEYSREVWIFDAANLKKGPVCKLHHPDMQFAFTIHSLWVEACEPSPRDYQVDIIQDYIEVIQNFPQKSKREEMTQFMTETVFPYYSKNDSN